MNLEDELKKYLPHLKNLQPVLDKVAKSAGYIDSNYLTITDKLPSYFVDNENDKLYLILGKDEIKTIVNYYQGPHTTTTTAQLIDAYLYYEYYKGK